MKFISFTSHTTRPTNKVFKFFFITNFSGIKSKIDHFRELQIGSIWISPFYESPLVDMGYDISNFTNINPVFGTLADFEELSKEAEKRGRYTILYICRYLHVTKICYMIHVFALLWFKKACLESR